MVASIRRFLDLQAGSLWRDMRILLPVSEGTFLDVGCGAQPFRRLIPETVLYTGIDTADAESHFGYKVPNTLYFEGTTWPIADNSVETILCTETIEHVLDPSTVLDEARRCLKPGGRFILTVPFAARWHYIPHDYWRFTPSSLQHLLTLSGFSQIAVYSRGDQLTVACYKAMALFTPWLFPQSGSPVVRLLRQFAGLLLSPIFILLAVIGNLSLRASFGDDCLGYTILAMRST